MLPELFPGSISFSKALTQTLILCKYRTMKIKNFLLLFLLLAVGQSYASVTWKVWNTEYRVDTTFHAQIGPGTTQTSLLLTGPDTTLTVFYLTVDLTNPYIDIRTVCAKDHLAGAQTVTEMAESHSVEGESLYFAGINGGFFAMSGKANDGKTSIVGRPHHATVAEGEIFRTSTSSVCRHFGITADKVPYLSNASVDFTGTITSATQSYEISGVNVDPANNKLILYTDKMPGQVTQVTGSSFPLYYEIALMPKSGEKLVPGKPCKMRVSGSWARGTNMAVPDGGYVISGKGMSGVFIQSLSDGDEVEVYLPMKFDGEEVLVDNLVTGNPKILGGGAVLDTEGERADAVEWHPRTSIGYSQDKKKLIMLVCDGRTSVSRGVRTRELADLMRYAGAYEALNLDGGGSSTLYTSMLGVRNYPSTNGVQRQVGDGVFVVSTAPRSVYIGGIGFATPPHVLAKGEEYTPEVYGYNAYGLLISTEVTNYTLTCDEGIGHITSDGKSFVADGSGKGKIYARTPAGYSCEMELSIREDVENLYFRLDSVVNDCHYRYPVEVLMTNLKGEEVSLAPQMLSWRSSDESVAVVDAGVLKGLKSGVAEVYGSMSGFTDTLLVKVQEPYDHCVNLNDGRTDWLRASFLTSAGFKNTSVTNSMEKGTEISFLYNSSSAKTITLSADMPLYSLPDTLRIRINPGAARLKSFSCTLRLPSGLRTIDLPVPAVNRESVAEIAFPDALGETIDMANYPLELSHLTLGMDLNTLGETYSITIPSVEVIYNYYNPEASDVERPTFAGPSWRVEGHTVVLDAVAERIELYNVAGSLVSLAQRSDRISAPGAGLYLVRVVSDGQAVSQKVWITK